LTPPKNEPGLVQIHYLRPPGRQDVFAQLLLLDDPDVKVTLARNLRFNPSIRIRNQVVLETGSDAVWFTFPGLWHDIGRFHRADGSFTGLYANILTPPVLRGDGSWQTTDLFLDVWMDPSGGLSILDEDQFLAAEDAGWIAKEEARRAREEVDWIVAEHRAGRWPPPIVEEWPLERALQSASSSRSQAAQRRPKSR
jgi:predicted RNA-binding protein associated with RNAse of E/G family